MAYLPGPSAAPMDMKPPLSIIIPTWNGAHLLQGALDSLRRQTWTGFETIVVDNGSTDGTRVLLEERYPEVRIVPLDRNHGFAVAVNAGVRAAMGSIFVLMNNDTEADPGWLAALARALNEHPNVGICASKMMDFNDRTRIDAAGDRWGVLPDQIGHGELDRAEFKIPRFVLSACAGAAAYRREVFLSIGEFDERFGTYLEDVDFGIRAHLTGYKCLYVPDAVIYHLGSATAGKLTEAKLYFLLRNSLFLFFQYLPISVMLRWGLAVLAYPMIRTRAERLPLRLALRATWDFARQLPAVWRRRRWVRQNRRISDAEFRAMLAPPVGPCHFGVSVPPVEGGGLVKGD